MDNIYSFGLYKSKGPSNIWKTKDLLFSDVKKGVTKKSNIKFDENKNCYVSHRLWKGSWLLRRGHLATGHYGINSR